jgi:hypothetical protein
MPNTYTLIASATVGAGNAATIDFSSIPSTYTDLHIVASLRTINSAVTDDLYLRFNGSTSSAYAYRTLQGNGTTTVSQSGSNSTYQYIGVIDGATATANCFSNTSIYVPNYASSSKKTTSVDGVMETNAKTAYSSIIANLWDSTAAINQVTLIGGYNSFVQYSTAYLYGIKKS